MPERCHQLCRCVNGARCRHSLRLGNGHEVDLRSGHGPADRLVFDRPAPRHRDFLLVDFIIAGASARGCGGRRWPSRGVETLAHGQEPHHGVGESRDVEGRGRLGHVVEAPAVGQSMVQSDGHKRFLRARLAKVAGGIDPVESDDDVRCGQLRQGNKTAGCSGHAGPCGQLGSMSATGSPYQMTDRTKLGPEGLANATNLHRSNRSRVGSLVIRG